MREKGCEKKPQAHISYFVLGSVGGLVLDPWSEIVNHIASVYRAAEIQVLYKDYIM